MDKKVKKLTKKLDLTEKQKNEVKTILAAKMEKKRALYKEFYKGLYALKSDTHGDIAGVLNDEQKAEFEKYAKKKRGKGCKRCRAGKHKKKWKK